MAEPVSQVVSEIAAGDALTLAELAASTPAYRGSGTASKARFSRYISHGCRAKSGSMVKLEAARFGQQILTSRAAVARFMTALNSDTPAGTSTETRTRTPTERRKAGEAADKRLTKAGA